MMNCTLLVPALFWPRDAADAMFGGLALESLTRLLSRSRAQRFAPIGTEGWLCGAFEIERQQDWPIAPLTLALDGGDADGAYWLRADPVHLKVERDRLALVQSALFDLGAEEAQALAGALDRHFSGEGVTFHAPHPKRWYARLEAEPRLVTHSIAEAAGRDVQPFLPSGEDALGWHRVFNEAQMLLHGHPVNTAREARGEPIVNSVWLWGGGTRAAVPGKPFSAVWSDDASAVAIAAAAGTHAAGVPADAESWLDAAARRDRVIAPGASADAHLVVLDDLTWAAAYRDVDTWRGRLSALEAHWFAPLVHALAERRIASLALVSPGASSAWRFDSNRADLRKFWRRARAWSEFE
jgi:hypothetical protein